MSKRYFVYLRKSSESEERQALSIPAQREALEGVIARLGLHVVREFEESMSAKRPGRPLFNEMMARIKKGEADGIICWHLDRLARNPLDGGVITWMLGNGEITEIVTPDTLYSGSGDDKMLMSVILGMATKYVDDLSKNVKRGNLAAVRQGRWIGRPKLGYVRDPETKQIVPDPERFDIIRQIWQEMLAGRPVMEILERVNCERGFTTPTFGCYGGGPLLRSQIYNLFRDRFYTGAMVYNGELLPGNHKPMITQDEFDQVQAMLDGRSFPPQMAGTIAFPYRGLLRCGQCNAKVTARHLTKPNGRKYIYYHCCRKVRGRKSFCPQPYVEQSLIEQQVVDFLRMLVPPRQWLNEAKRIISEVEAQADAAAETARQRREHAAHQLELRLGRVRRLLVDGVLSEDDYKLEYNKLMDEKLRLESGRKEITDSPCMEPLTSGISLLKQAHSQFLRISDNEKTQLLKSLVWNAELKDKKVLILAKEPFATMAKWSSCLAMSSWLDEVRNLLARLATGDPMEEKPETMSRKEALLAKQWSSSNKSYARAHGLKGMETAS